MEIANRYRAIMKDLGAQRGSEIDQEIEKGGIKSIFFLNKIPDPILERFEGGNGTKNR